MAKKSNRQRRSSAEVAEERVRTLRAKLESVQLKAALSYYKAAERGRGTRDWRPNAASADLALIPEQGSIVARSRQAVANTWVGKAALRAHKRNVIGRGIMVVPTAVDAAGNDLPELNKAASDDFMNWSSDQSAVDVEGRRTYWQMQRSMISEEFVAGEVFVIWSYEPHSRRAGLKLQLVEHEQLDQSIQRFGGNEVRGGIEVDGNGKPVAYHFYKRNPNDYLSTRSLESVRVDASRVLHYFDAERSQQSHGEPRLAPVLPEIRSLYALHEATLWRARMEACIGLVVTRNSPSGVGFSPTTPYAAGSTGTNANGSRSVDFRPGMFFEAQPGESVSNVGMVTPGATYAPFTEQCLRGIGAGIGMSYGALTRHNDANYSAARQDMLEDEREIGPQQDLFIDRICLPVWELYYTIAMAEGRLPLESSDFYDAPDRYMEADFVTPVRPWIDPEKEANAYEKALKLHIATRSEIVAMKGGRLQNLLKQRKAETDMAKTNGITFSDEADITATRSNSAAQFAKADSDRANAEATRKPPPEPAPDTKAVEALAAIGTDRATAHDLVSKRLAAASVPNYRKLSLPQMSCATCESAVGMVCKRYDFEFEDGHVCDQWSVNPLNEMDESGGSKLPPGRSDGEPAFEDTSARDGLLSEIAERGFCIARLGWITINGTPVLVDDDGEISAGPSKFVGKTPAELPSTSSGVGSTDSGDGLTPDLQAAKRNWTRQAEKMSTPKLKRAIENKKKFASKNPNAAEKLATDVLENELKKRSSK